MSEKEQKETENEKVSYFEFAKTVCEFCGHEQKITGGTFVSVFNILSTSICANCIEKGIRKVMSEIKE